MSNAAAAPKARGFGAQPSWLWGRRASCLPDHDSQARRPRAPQAGSLCPATAVGRHVDRLPFRRAQGSTPYQNPLQGRAAKPHDYLIGAVACARFAYLIGVAHVATTHTDEVLVGPIVWNRRDHYAITVNVDIGRSRPAPCEIHRVSPLDSAPSGAKQDRARRR